MQNEQHARGVHFALCTLHFSLCIAVAVCVVPSLALAHETLPAQLQDVGIEEHLGARIPLDLPFRDESGATVTLKSFFDGRRPVVLTFAYYECPMLCGLLLNGVTTGYRALDWSVGEQFQFVNVSIDPRETPDLARAKRDAHLGAYGRTHAAAGWHFLVGDEANIRALTEAVGFRYRYDAAQRQYAHAATLLVAAPDGTLTRYLYGIDFPARDLRLALLEASRGAIGTIMDRLLMYCYHYDPATRKYGLLATRAMRVGAAATVVGLALLLVVLRRRRRGSLPS